MILAAALTGPTAPPPESSPDPSTHRWRLHVDATPAFMRSIRQDGAVTFRRWRLGLPGAVSIGFGRVLGRYVTVGTRLGGYVDRSASRVSGLSTLADTRVRTVAGGGSLAPYAEIRPMPALRIQPFGLVEGGVEISGVRRRSSGPLVLQPERTLRVKPSVGGRVGMHAFVRPRLSIDADLGLQRYWIYEWRASPAIGPDSSAAQPTRLTLAATVGLSGWW